MFYLLLPNQKIAIIRECNETNEKKRNFKNYRNGLETFVMISNLKIKKTNSIHNILMEKEWNEFHKRYEKDKKYEKLTRSVLDGPLLLLKK